MAGKESDAGRENAPTTTAGINIVPIHHAIFLSQEQPIKMGLYEYYYDDEELEGVLPNATGCARSESFRRPTTEQKIAHRRKYWTAERSLTEKVRTNSSAP